MGRAQRDSGLRLRMRGEGRRIASQHRQLDELFGLVLISLDDHDAAHADGDFDAFSTALEAHLSMEEEIYFPAFHGLRADLAPDLVRLVAEHEDLRAAVDAIRSQLRAGRAADARVALDSLAGSISSHESAEESLMARVTTLRGGDGDVDESG